MYENNSIWYLLGNRTLNSLNLQGCNISEVGLKLILDMVTEQEVSVEQLCLLLGTPMYQNNPLMNAMAEGSGYLGIFRVSLLVIISAFNDLGQSID
jgi:hypothetical protein